MTARQFAEMTDDEQTLLRHGWDGLSAVEFVRRVSLLSELRDDEETWYCQDAHCPAWLTLGPVTHCHAEVA